MRQFVTVRLMTGTIEDCVGMSSSLKIRLSGCCCCRLVHYFQDGGFLSGSKARVEFETLSSVVTTSYQLPRHVKFINRSDLLTYDSNALRFGRNCNASESEIQSESTFQHNTSSCIDLMVMIHKHYKERDDNSSFLAKRKKYAIGIYS